AHRSLVPAVEDSPDRDLLADDLGITYHSAVVDAPGAEAPVTGARAGARAPHAWVEQDGETVSMLDLYDDRLTVVTGPGGTAWREAVAELAADGLPIQVVEIGHDVVDPDGRAAARYRVSGSTAVLVRPDGHVTSHLRGTAAQATDLLQDAVQRALG